MGFIDRPDPTVNPTSPGSGNAYPKGTYINVLDGVAGTVYLQTAPISLEDFLPNDVVLEGGVAVGSVLDATQEALVTSDMSIKQAPVYAIPKAAAGSPTWHLSRTALAVVNRVPTLDPNTKTIAGTSTAEGSGNGTGAAARFSSPNGLCFDLNNNLIVCDLNNHLLRKVNVTTGEVTTLCGTAGASGLVNGTTGTKLYSPEQPICDTAGNIYFSESGNWVIRKLTPAGVLSTNPQTPAQCQHSDPYNGIAMDAAGNLYNFHSCRIHKITPAGVVSDFAGTAGQAGSANGTGTAARFSTSVDNLWCDKATGNIYVADTGNHLIRKITPAGVVTTVAGGAGVAGSVDGNGTAARFNTPRAVVMDSKGYLFVTDFGNHTIRMIGPGGTVTTIAGAVGVVGAANGIGAAARFNKPDGLAIHPVTGNIYVSEAAGNTIRMIPTPHPDTQAAHLALAVSYNGEDIPAMSKGSIPAGWQVFLASEGLTDGGIRTGYTQAQGVGPRSVYFVPYFKAAEESNTLIGLGNGDFSWTMNFLKPLNSNQKPNATVTLTINGVATTLTPTWVKNTSLQITGLMVTIPAAKVTVSNANGTLTVVISESITYLKGLTVVTETIPHMNKVITKSFSATGVTPPLISAARVLLQSECAAGDQPTVLQYVYPATGVWFASESVWTRFSAKVQAANATLARWELWWELQSYTTYNTGSSGWIPTTKPMPSKKLIEGTFAAGLSEVSNKDVNFNTYDQWPIGSAGAGCLLLKVFDNFGNSKSIQVAQPVASWTATGNFVNAGLTGYTEKYNWSRNSTTDTEGGYLRCYISGGPGLDNVGGANYPPQIPCFINHVNVVLDNNPSRLYTYGKWLYNEWDYELAGRWQAGAQDNHFVITTKSGRVVHDHLKFTIASFPVVVVDNSCCLRGDTLVGTPTGPKQVKDIQVGDTVYSWDPQVSPDMAAVPVTKLWKSVRDHHFRLKFQDGGELFVSNDHPLYTADGRWVAMDADAANRSYGDTYHLNVAPLTTGTALKGFQADHIVTAIDRVDSTEPLYTFDVQDPYNTYFAGGVLVHNNHNHN